MRCERRVWKYLTMDDNPGCGTAILGRRTLPCSIREKWEIRTLILVSFTLFEDTFYATCIYHTICRLSIHLFLPPFCSSSFIVSFCYAVQLDTTSSFLSVHYSLNRGSYFFSLPTGRDPAISRSFMVTQRVECHLLSVIPYRFGSLVSLTFWQQYSRRSC